MVFMTMKTMIKLVERMAREGHSIRSIQDQIAREMPRPLTILEAAGCWRAYQRGRA